MTRGSSIGYLYEKHKKQKALFHEKIHTYISFASKNILKNIDVQIYSLSWGYQQERTEECSPQRTSSSLFSCSAVAFVILFHMQFVFDQFILFAMCSRT